MFLYYDSISLEILFFLATDQEISISLWLVIRYKLAQAIVLKVFSLLFFFFCFDTEALCL